MITLINNGDRTFNAVRVGQMIDVEEKFVSVYEEYGFEKISESSGSKEKKQTLKKIAPKGDEQK